MAPPLHIPFMFSRGHRVAHDVEEYTCAYNAIDHVIKLLERLRTGPTEKCVRGYCLLFSLPLVGDMEWGGGRGGTVRSSPFH